MSTSGEWSVGVRRLGRIALAAAAILAVSAPVLGGIPKASIDKVVEHEKAAARRAAGADGYVLRCWQYGRLIIEEQRLVAPARLESRALPLKLIEDDRRLFLFDAGNATCLIRPNFFERDRSHGK